MGNLQQTNSALSRTDSASEGVSCEFNEHLLNVDFSDIPEGWFLYKLCHEHSRIIYAGDKHIPHGWRAELRHGNSGRLCAAVGGTPQDALDKVCGNVGIK